MISRERVTALLEAMPKRRVVVVGDAMLDIYMIGDVERISPEATTSACTAGGRASRRT